MNHAVATDAAKLASRILLAALFLMSGWSKIGGYASMQNYMQSAGVPGMLLPIVIAFECVGGLLIVVGYQTRWLAIALAGFSLLTAVLFHGAPAQQTMFLKNLAIAGGFLALFASGAGRYSIDARMSNDAGLASRAA